MVDQVEEPGGHPLLARRAAATFRGRPTAGPLRDDVLTADYLAPPGPALAWRRQQPTAEMCRRNRLEARFASAAITRWARSDDRPAAPPLRHSNCPLTGGA